MAPFEDAEVASISVDHRGRVLTTWVSRAEHERVAKPADPDHPFPDEALPYASGRLRPVPAVITAQDPDVVSVVASRALDLDDAMVQAMPGGGFLVVNPRCWWRPAGPELNATVLDDEGWVVRRACLGDGITSVQTTADGAIWVGYSDEGVYGNLGWGEPGAPPQIGAPGIRRFTPDLVPEWAFAHGRSLIDDCYALNVVGDTAWAYYYSDFPIARVTGGQVQLWPTHDLTGAKHVLVGEGQVGLVGGYGGNRDRVVVGTLEEVFTPQVEVRLVMPDGRAVPSSAVDISRGDRLDVFCGRDWFQVRLEDLTG